MHSHLLHDIGLCIVAATVLAYIARIVNQPLILAYIGAGVLIGPVGLELVNEQKSIETLAELGLAFLLFIVGLEIDLKKLVASGRAATIVTIVQVAGSGLLGWAAAFALGYGGLPAVYIGAALAFSSTMIVVKLLSDRAELDTLPGQMTLAILLVQDVLAIVVLAIQPQLGGGGEGSPIASIGLSVAKGLGLGIGAVVASRYALPRLFRSAAETPEILLLTAITWCFLVSFAAMKAGFSVAMGALIAGVSMAELPYALDVIAKIRSLRDFFVTLFFVSLGMLITKPTAYLLGATIALAALTLVSRFATILPVLRLIGYDNRIGILSSIHLSQISEFALVIALIGVSDTNRHIGPEIVSLIVMTLVVTSTVSTDLVRFQHKIASRLLRALAGTKLEDRQVRDSREVAVPKPEPIILVGCFRVASCLVNDLRAAGKDFAVIDFNPLVHAQLKKLGVACTYGDISHIDTLEHAGVCDAKILISSISDDFLRGTDNAKLLETLRKLNPHAKVFVTADSIRRAIDLYQAGADYVVVPRMLAADRLLEVIERAEAGELERLRAQEIEKLGQREEVIP
jgi:Kef-type K+ transport system membrane component KefB